MNPPASGPRATASAVTPLQAPTARVRCRASGNIAEMIASVVGVASAAPAPCSTRPASSTLSPVASPEISEAAVNSAVPARNSRRRPYRSASRPPASSRLANTST